MSLSNISNQLYLKQLQANKQIISNNKADNTSCYPPLSYIKALKIIKIYYI